MTRILKNTVDYFPHYANASTSDTLTVLQSKFGNNGYAFWFKLLEKLAATEGHYLDYRNPTKWKLFVAKMGLDEITTVEMLNLLVEMQAIDKDLWESKLIWCQTLVDNLSEVYKNRRRELPQKPIPTNNNSITTVDIPPKLNIACISTGDNPLISPEIPQSRGRGGEERRGEGRRGSNNSSSNSSENIFEIYEQEIGQLTPIISDELKDAEKEYSDDIVIDAIKEAGRANKRNWRYINGILENWRKTKGANSQDIIASPELTKFGGRQSLIRIIFVRVKDKMEREPASVFISRLMCKSNSELLNIYNKLSRE